MTLPEARIKTEGSHDRDTDAIPRLIMLLFVGAFAAGAVIGYFTQGFGFFGRSSTPASNTATTQPAAPAPPAQPTRVTPPPKPIAAPAPISPRPARVTSPDYAAPAKARVGSEAPGSIGAASTVFRVQVGAFRIRKNAEILVQRLEGDGFRAYIAHANGLYKVRIGPFTDPDDAKRLIEELRVKDYDAFVSP